MSAKKKRPSFDLPDDLQSAPQAGWVYRSDTTTKPEPPAAAGTPLPDPDSTDNFRTDDAAEPDLDPGFVDLTWRTLESGISAMNNAVRLGMHIMTTPIRVGRWFISRWQ